MKIKSPKMLCSMALAVFFLMLPFSVWAGDEGVIKGSVVNLRSGAGLDKEVVTKAETGQGLTILSTSGEWLQVRLYNGNEGWVHKDYIELITVLKKVVVKGSYINLRTGPATSFAKAGQAQGGLVLPVLAQKDEWYQVYAPGIGEAWIAGWLTTVQETAATNITPPASAVSNTTNTPVVATVAQTRYVRIKTKILNIRKEPNTTAAILAKVSLNESYELLEEKAEWYRIKKGDVSGWVSAQYTEIFNKPVSEIKTPPTAEIKGTPATDTVTITGTTVNIRKEANTTSGIITKVKTGDKLKAVLKQGDWVKVQLPDGRQGWIAAWLTDAAVAASPSPPVTSIVESEVLIAPIADGKTFKIIASASRPILQLEGWTDSQYKINLQKESNKIVIELEAHTERDYEGKNTPLGIQNIRIYANGDKAMVEVTFSYPPMQVVNYDAASLLTKIQISPAQTTGLSNKIIVLDPGHASVQPGGWLDPGAIGKYTGIKEKDINLDISQKLKTMLENAGARVIMTHTGQTSLSLAARAGVANSARADIFVSIHANYSLKNGIAGHSTYYYGPAADALLGQQRYSRQKLAVFIQREMSAVGGRKNVGTIEKNFAVLRETTVPSVLIETAYLSDAEEETLLSTEAYRQTLALGIFNGIRLYFE